MSEDLMNVMPTNYAEAENLINRFYNEAGQEKNWFSAEEEETVEQKPEVKPVKGFDMSKVNPKLLGKTEPEGKAPVDQPQAQSNSAFEVEIDGQKISLNQDDLRKYVQSGYKAEQKYNEIIQEQQRVLKERAEFEKNIGKYEHMAKLDDWAKQNPELYHRLTLEYENMQNGGNFGEVPPYLGKFVAKLDQIESRFSEIDNFKKNQQVQAEDQALDAEIKSFKEQYPQFDWKDSTLEKQIIMHAQQNGIKSFRAAARDMLYDDLVKRTEIKAKEQIGKEIQKNHRLGEVQKRSESTSSQKPVNVSKLNWNQLGELVKNQMGVRDY